MMATMPHLSTANRCHLLCVQVPRVGMWHPAGHLLLWHLQWSRLQPARCHLCWCIQLARLHPARRLLLSRLQWSRLHQLEMIRRLRLLYWPHSFVTKLHVSVAMRIHFCTIFPYYHGGMMIAYEAYGTLCMGIDLLWFTCIWQCRSRVPHPCDKGLQY